MFRSIAAAGLAALLLPLASAQLTPFEQDFEGLAASDPGAVSADGWLGFANVFDPGGGFLYGYGPFGAPNGGPGFSSLASSAFATARQGAQQLNVYSDYNNGDHANGNYIEANVFQERTIDASNVGQTWTFSFDYQAAPVNAGEADSTMIAFIKVLQSSNGTFALLAFPTRDTTDAPLDSFDCGQISITIDPAWAGELLQFGFASTATLFNDTGRYYDNVSFQEGGSPVAASTHRLLYSTLPGSTTADVPGAPGRTFALGDTSAFFDISALHSDLSAIAFTAQVDAASTAEDEVLMVNGEARLFEGTDPMFTDAGELLGNFDSRVEVNSAGEFAFQNDTTGDSATDNYIVKGDLAGNYTVIAREGSAFAPLAGATTGNNLESPNIAADGTVSYYVEGVSGGSTTTTTDNFIVSNASVVIQQGVTPLTGDSAGEFLDTVDLNDLIYSENGAHWLARGDLTQNVLTTSTDDCLIVDGEVVIRELQPLPGGAATEIVDTIGIFGHKINNSGSWIARGDLDPPFENEDWVLIDGTLVARTGQPIHAGATELWSASIFGVEMNDDGDYLVAGGTDSADSDRDGVIVLNGERVICRERDPVDVDMNGLFDDDAFLSFFAGDNMVLGNRSEGLTAIFVATVRDGAGNNLGQGVFTIDLAGVVGSSICLAEPNSTGLGARTVALGSTDTADNDLTLHSSQLPAGSLGYFVTSLETILVANPAGSEGNLCIGSFVMGRYNEDVLVADAAGTAFMCVELGDVPQPMSTTIVMPGETRYWQLWYRDTDVTGAPTSNFAEAVGVTFGLIGGLPAELAPRGTPGP